MMLEHDAIQELGVHRPNTSAGGPDILTILGGSKMHLQEEIHELVTTGAARPDSRVDNPLPCEDRDMQTPTSWHWP